MSNISSTGKTITISAETISLNAVEPINIDNIIIGALNTTTLSAQEVTTTNLTSNDAAITNVAATNVTSTNVTANDVSASTGNFSTSLGVEYLTVTDVSANDIVVSQGIQSNTMNANIGEFSSSLRAGFELLLPPKSGELPSTGENITSSVRSALVTDAVMNRVNAPVRAYLKIVCINNMVTGILGAHSVPGIPGADFTPFTINTSGTTMKIIGIIPTQFRPAQDKIVTAGILYSGSPITAKFTYRNDGDIYMERDGGGWGATGTMAWYTIPFAYTLD